MFSINEWNNETQLLKQLQVKSPAGLQHPLWWIRNRREEEGSRVQLLSLVLVWPEDPQLVDLVAFAEIGRHDPVPLSDATPEHGDVGHHSSVVVEIVVKHEGFERSVDARCGPDVTRMEGGKKKKRINVHVSKHVACERRKPHEPSYGGILSTTAWRTASTFVPSLAEIWKKDTRRKEIGRRFSSDEQQWKPKQQGTCAPTHPNAFVTGDIKHLFNLRLHPHWISIFQINLKEKKCQIWAGKRMWWNQTMRGPRCTLLMTGTIASWASKAR